MIAGRAIDIRARAVAWVKADPPGAEFAEIQLESRRLRARGVAIGSDPEPYRLSFELQTREEYITDRAVVETQGAGWTRQLEIQRGPTGVWSASSQSAGKLEMPRARRRSGRAGGRPRPGSWPLTGLQHDARTPDVRKGRQSHMNETPRPVASPTWVRQSCLRWVRFLSHMNETPLSADPN
jgi:hypothetical protein